MPYSTVLEVSICGFVMASFADLIVFCDPYQKLCAFGSFMPLTPLFIPYRYLLFEEATAPKVMGRQLVYI